VSVEPPVGGGSAEVHGISVDITDLKRAEAELEVVVKELEEARQRFLDLVNNLDEAIVWEADAATSRISFVSARGETITGFPIAEWKRDPEFWSAHMPTEDWAAMQEIFRKSRSRESDERCEHRFIRRDGVVRWMRTGIHFRRSGHDERFQGVSLDITAQREKGKRAAKT
jgi:PAS domain S-box-containing protein